jgi:flagellar protein FliS
VSEVLTEEILHKKTAQELTLILYKECLNRMKQSVEAIEKKNFVLANESLQRTNDILYRLGAGLNYEAGIIADELESLYNYMAHRIIEANLSKKVEPILESIEILEEIVQGWSIAIDKKVDSANNILHRQRSAAYDR